MGYVNSSYALRTDLEIGDFYANETLLEFEYDYDRRHDDLLMFQLERWHLGNVPMNRHELVAFIGEDGVRKVEESALDKWREALADGAFDRDYEGDGDDYAVAAE
jgi:hypothetical protein